MKKVYILLGIFALIILAGSPKKALAADQNFNLNAFVTATLALVINQNGAIPFGNLAAGNPLVGPGGTEISVTTSSQFGYDLSIDDGVAGADSALVHSDNTTRISDYAGTIAAPTLWNGTGLGFSLYSGSGKDAKWGTGVTFNDINNKYAGVPQITTVIMSKSGYLATPDISYIGWKVDVPNNQKTGSYGGNITLTATPGLN